MLAVLYRALQPPLLVLTHRWWSARLARRTAGLGTCIGRSPDAAFEERPLLGVS